jgi:hypothetical protein
VRTAFRRLRSNRYRLVAIVVVILLLTGLAPRHASAAVTLVNSNDANSSASPVAASLPAAAVAGNLLVAVCSAKGAATFTAPTGFSTAINETSDPAMGIFYKVAVGGETSMSCSFTGGPGKAAIQILQYSGIENVTPLNAVTAGGSTGSTATASTGSLTTTNASDLLVAVVTSDTNTVPGTWGSSFTGRTSGSVGGSPSGRMGYAAADFLASSTGTYSTTAAVANGNNWRGQMAAFKIAPAVAFGVDIVDGSGNAVASPSVTFSTLPTNFTCQSSSGTLGAAAQKIRVTNTTPSNSNGWSLGIAATSGTSATWTAGALKMDYNDAGGSGCSDGDADGAKGQLSIDPTSETITPESSPEAGCTMTGVSALGTTTAFTAAQSSIALATAGSTSSYYCYWDITGLSLVQKIPANQTSGAYSINLTLTLTAL